jgi:XTP/dITP diphosphohydrolase
MGKVLIASGNPGKFGEIRALLEGLNLELVTPQTLGLQVEVHESGQSYAENAAIKAKAFLNATGLVTLADDSGLEVDLLGGLPGIRSARFSSVPGASDADRRAYLLECLKGLLQPWRAHFHCTVALAFPGKEIQFRAGECHGEIIAQERGANGFGYDPIFYIPELGVTMAELSMEEKNRISHRARAIKAAIPLLTEM